MEAGYAVIEVQRILEPSGKISVYAFAVSRAGLKDLLG